MLRSTLFATCMCHKCSIHPLTQPIVLPRTAGPTNNVLLRSDESDADSLLAVNYAGFAPVLVEGLKELEEQQRLESDEVQDKVLRLKEVAQYLRSELGVAREEVRSLKELAQEQQLEMEAWRTLSGRQTSELGVAQEQIRSLTESVRQQRDDLEKVKELAGQLLQLQTEQKKQSDAAVSGLRIQ